MSSARRRWPLVALQVLVVAAVLWFASDRLAGQWAQFRAEAGALRPRWWLVGVSALLVLTTYGMLVEAWRVLVRAAGGRLGYRDAVRIWTVSNLGRYVPGKVWSVGAMGVLAQRAGVSPVAAAGAAIVGTLVNLAAGFVVVLACGGPMLRVLAPDAAALGAVAAAVAAAGLLALPLVAGPLAALLARALGRELAAPRIGARPAVVAVAATVTSWLLYGAAFRLLARAFFPAADSAGDWLPYVAVFTGSYLAGYLALLMPGGLVVREGAMIAGLTGLGLATAPQAAVLAVASRLWLTVLEVAPGLVFLARDAVARSPRPSSDASS